MENAYSLILFGANKDRYFQQILEELNPQKLICQESLKEELKINPIIVKSKTLNLEIFKQIKEQLTDNVILLNGVFYPENNWLIYLIRIFNKQPTNLLVGNVINDHFFSKLFQKQSNSLSNQIEHIFNNCLVKKNC